MNVQDIIGVLQLVVVVGTVVGSVWKLSKPLRTIGDRIERLEMYSHNDYMRELRLTIMSDELPIEERLEAGEKYIKEGGNGPVKVKYHMLQEEYQKEQDGNKDG